ncbi:M20 family metallopeptidase [Teichococcus oryzae]|uniref:M20 family metallopeptidase n=1 Tax=Teichococcus oryzae TaxID=1608942 RepID=A0A5B2TLP8_9PROT|nr:M20 family metallopeptidase [Pseudoroseomonas oryzae]KAA2214858.1 M20 family metallopeptidase [Pseudoroseomonas oryzae]
MAGTESRITEWLATQQDAMLAELEAMVNTDGGSYDKAGVDAVGERVKAFCARHGIPVETIPGAKHGDCLRATVAGGDGLASGNARQNIVLMGHRDTVFPKGEPERRPFTVKDGIATGPGVCDMKAGLVQNMFVLAAFAQFGGAPGPLVGLFTGDEEIGSPEGRPVIEKEARAARVVFNSEPGRPSGGVVTGRKGGVFMVMDIEGKAAHSGGNFEAGISAIEELARKVQAIHALTDIPRGITLNVGLVSGGQSVNTVAPWAQGQIDLRYIHPEDRDEVMGRIEGIVAQSFVPGTRASLTIRGEFLPLAKNAGTEAVFALYRQAAAESGLDTQAEFAGGCADSGFTAAQGAPTLCAVGPVGGRAHSPEEYLEVATLVPRAQALARAILKLDAAGI